MIKNRNSILILGAKSKIAKSLSLFYANHNYDLIFAGRNSNRELKDFMTDLKERYEIEVHAVEFDILDFSSHKKFYDSIPKKPLGVISFIGLTDNQLSGNLNINDKKTIINTNFLGIMNLVDIIVDDFIIKNNRGWIMVVSSIAAERGSNRNNIYACSKSALNTYLEGKRTSLIFHNIKIITIKLGIVNTRMIKGINYPNWLISEPERIARLMFVKQQNSIEIAYIPSYWRFIMFIIRNLPRNVYSKIIKD